jgi:hypothetical protein
MYGLAKLFDTHTTPETKNDKHRKLKNREESPHWQTSEMQSISQPWQNKGGARIRQIRCAMRAVLERVGRPYRSRPKKSPN